jgi:hypothetical protein
MASKRRRSAAVITILRLGTVCFHPQKLCRLLATETVIATLETAKSNSWAMTEGIQPDVVYSTTNTEKESVRGWSKPSRPCKFPRMKSEI